MDGKRILIANRGECACRIIRTCEKLGITTIAVYTEEDTMSLHTRQADESVHIRSYLDIQELVQVALDKTADAVHPGWGFLSENPLFEEACSKNNILFVGPTAANMDIMTNKVAARAFMQEVGVPVLPGSSPLANAEEAVAISTQMGFPIMLKAANGGGGIGIYRCNSEQEVITNFRLAKRQVMNAFGDDILYIEKCMSHPRHIEVQVFGDGCGNAVTIGERDCSVQRRNQKIIEETPAPGLTNKTRRDILRSAIEITRRLNYRSSGTVEFLMDKDTQQFYFMEFNTRLQVEHGITEMCFDVDLVEWMFALSFGCLDVVLGKRLQEWNTIPRGHAIQVRIYAENTINNFKPSPGTVTAVNIHTETDTRVDTGVYPGFEILPVYDPMILKILQWAPDRQICLGKMIHVLERSEISGPPNNLMYIVQFLKSTMFQFGVVTTSVLNDFHYAPRCFEVLNPGLMTTVQDWPGRVRQGLWRVGVPPSGPMDHLACRVANTLVGNEESAAVLEICIRGPILKFHCAGSIAVTGAPMEVNLDGSIKQQWTSFEVKQGSVLDIRSSASNSTVGYRTYLSVAGGIKVPTCLGSRSTFMSGHFGGYQGRALHTGDLLSIDENEGPFSVKKVDQPFLPAYTNAWQIGCLPGPFAEPDYFTGADIEMFYSTLWKVHHDSNRLGVRLVGPSPGWARKDGGEGGSHPSNVHDYVYSIGSVNFTGDMPIIIAHDGPSLGGFVCPATIVQSELWKVGQVRPGDTVQFHCMDIDEANHCRRRQNSFISSLVMTPDGDSEMTKWAPKKTEAVLEHRRADDSHPGFQIRLSGDTYINIEYGPMVLDLNLRCRIHFLEQELLQKDICGIEETAPGVRTLQIKYNPDQIYLQQLIMEVLAIDSSLPDISNSDWLIESRIIRLPLCFNHSGVSNAIERYMRTVRKEAVYLPSNIEFIAKNNGLQSSQDVFDKVFSASYMCLGLGDVYLNSPCAVPLNPLHRLVNPKYNPARTYTQEGTVGLGGAYMCIYTMDSPGGYQLVGRSLPIWNTYGVGNKQQLFTKDKPWLLQMFDQIRFFSVTEAELEEMRLDFRNGKLQLDVTNSNFSVRAYNAEMLELESEIKGYQTTQQAAAAAMNALHINQQISPIDQSQGMMKGDEQEVGLHDGQTGVYADMPGVVGEILVKVTDEVVQNKSLLVLCAMKMENNIPSPVSGVVSKITVKVGEMVSTGQLLVIVN